MADFLEDTEAGDADRRIDACGFRRQQFDIFKNQFREAFDHHGHSQLANLVLEPALKKDVVNTLRRLQRAKFALEKIPEQCAVESLTKKMSEIYAEISRMSKGDDEFTMDNVRLPDVDESALHMLFGEPLAADPSGLADLQELNRRFAEKVNEALGAAQLLLNEYDELMNFLKRGGTPTAPIPK